MSGKAQQISAPEYLKHNITYGSSVST